MSAVEHIPILRRTFRSSQGLPRGDDDRLPMSLKDSASGTYSSSQTGAELALLEQFQVQHKLSVTKVSPHGFEAA